MIHQDLYNQSINQSGQQKTCPRLSVPRLGSTRFPLKHFVIGLLFSVVFNQSVVAQPPIFSVLNEEVHQLVDVCRVSVRWQVDYFSAVFSFGVLVADDPNEVDNRTALTTITANPQGRFSARRRDNSLASLLRVTYPEVLVEPTETEFNARYTFNVETFFTLPRNEPNRQLLVGLGRFPDFGFSKYYSIANDCPKGN